MTLDHERFDPLLERYFDQLLDGDGLEELGQMLLESPVARDRFWEVAQFHGALRQVGQEQWGLLQQPTPRAAAHPAPAPSRRRPHASTSSATWWPLALAAMLVVGLVGWLVLPRPHPPERGLAVLTSTSGAVWSEGALAPRPGEVLTSEVLHLTAGFICVEFLRGARVVIEGPAEFRPVSDGAGELRHGRLSAVVPPPAHGFQITGGGLTVTDYGTEFGCIVPRDGPPEVHVFSGEVGVRPPSDTQDELRLKESEAVQLEAKLLRRMPADASEFVRETELLLRDRAASDDRFERWLEFSREFRQRPDLIAYLDFQSPDGNARSLPNLAPHASPESTAAIVGATWSQGRMNGKTALEFKGSNERVRLTVPGTFEALTFLAWIRPGENRNRLNGLAMGGTGDQLGETHWYIYLNGALGTGIRLAPRGHRQQWRHSHSERQFAREMRDEWVLVVTVIDRKAETISHYINGVPSGGETVKIDPLLRLGTVEIGNSNLQASLASELGNFQGHIDEVAILSGTLTPAEIRTIYTVGRPGL